MTAASALPITTRSAVVHTVLGVLALLALAATSMPRLAPYADLIRLACAAFGLGSVAAAKQYLPPRVRVILDDFSPTPSAMLPTRAATIQDVISTPPTGTVPPGSASNLGVLLLLGGVLTLSACASDMTVAQKSVSAAATLGIAAGNVAIAVDEATEGDIAAKLAVDHDTVAARAAEDAWHTKRLKLSQALKSYSAFVAASAVTVQLTSKDFDLASFLGQLAGAYTSLRGALASYGVNIPAGAL